MNLSPQWTAFFAENGVQAKHWVDLGDPTARDSDIMDFARANGFIVFTHDLDFGNHPGCDERARSECRPGANPGSDTAERRPQRLVGAQNPLAPARARSFGND
jgi:Domain of unknown function (DUF5615)